MVNEPTVKTTPIIEYEQGKSEPHIYYEHKITFTPLIDVESIPVDYGPSVVTGKFTFSGPKAESFIRQLEGVPSPRRQSRRKHSRKVKRG